MRVISVRDCADVVHIRRHLVDLTPCLDFAGLLGESMLENSDIPNDIIEPKGCLHIAESGSHVIGCMLLQKVDDDVCELKRLFVLPGFRRQGIGSMLVKSALIKADNLGFNIILLDTLASMKDAISIYERLGFKMMPPNFMGRASKTLHMIKVIGDLAVSSP